MVKEKTFPSKLKSLSKLAVLESPVSELLSHWLSTWLVLLIEKKNQSHTDVCYCRKLLSLQTKLSIYRRDALFKGERKGKKNFFQRQKECVKIGEKMGLKNKKPKEGFTLKGLPLGLWNCQCVESELDTPS